MIYLVIGFFLKKRKWKIHPFPSNSERHKTIQSPDYHRYLKCNEDLEVFLSYKNGFKGSASADVINDFSHSYLSVKQDVQTTKVFHECLFICYMYLLRKGVSLV